MREAESSTGRPGRIAGEDIEETPFVSQKDFRPTPYAATTWEFVGEQVKERDFVPLAVNIVHTDATEPDPMFDVFDPGFHKEDEALFHGAGTQRPRNAEEELTEEMKAAHLAELEAEWQAKVDAAHQAGVEEGTRATQIKIMERYEVLSERLKSITDSIYQQWSNQAAALEKHALDLSLQIARKIVATTVEVKPDYILGVIRQALSELGAAKPVRIRVSLDDFEFLNVIGLPVELSTEELGVTYVADESIKSGCVVETDFGEVDMLLDRMWEEIKDNIYKAKP